MNIIDRTAVSLARSIRSHYPEAASEAVLKYSLSLTINTGSAIIAVLVICSVTGRLWQGLAAIMAFLFIRYISGGVHLSSSLSCCLTAIVMITTLVHLPMPYWPAGFALNAAAALVMLLLSPNGIRNVSRIDPSYYPLLKSLSVAAVCANFIIQSPLLALVFAVQAFSLTPAAYRLVALLERR